MNIKFFGDYLLSKELLSNEQYKEAVEFQSKNNLSLGEIAVNEGFLTKDEALKINERQLSHDQKFGEVAKELDLLDSENLEQLLYKQKQNNIPFGKVVEKLGFLPKECVDKELEEFELSQKSRAKHVLKELAFFDRDDIILDSIHAFEKLYLRVTKKCLKIENIDYFADSIKDKTLIVQNIKGEYDIFFAFVIDNGTQEDIVSALSKEELENCDGNRICFLSGFMDMYLKNISVELIADEIEAEVTASEVISSNDIDLSSYYRLDFLSLKGKLELYIKV